MLAASKPDLIVHSREPFNAEPPLPLLRRDFVTPLDSFYVRSHGPIPALDAAAHRVAVEGMVETRLALSAGELQARFAAHTVMAVMQCAGNRRADMQKVAPTSGDPWAPGAIGNALWTGARLGDVLREAGAAGGENLHVAFEGADIARGEGAPDAPYGVSIPLPKALCEEVLVAWAMNGAPLSPAHGAPLRLVVPGFAGARSIKWLRSIRVQEEPSQAFHQARDYLLFPPDTCRQTQSPSRGTPINAMPVNAAICEPAAGASLAAGPVALRGYAIASGRRIVRVDVSGNGGASWCQAEIEPHGGSRWSWSFWQARLDLEPGTHELAVRAWDEAGQTQPAALADIWNFKGYLCSAWHRVRVTAA